MVPGSTANDGQIHWIGRTGSTFVWLPPNDDSAMVGGCRTEDPRFPESPVGLLRTRAEDMTPSVFTQGGQEETRNGQILAKITGITGSKDQAYRWIGVESAPYIDAVRQGSNLGSKSDSAWSPQPGRWIPEITYSTNCSGSDRTSFWDWLAQPWMVTEHIPGSFPVTQGNNQYALSLLKSIAIG